MKQQIHARHSLSLIPILFAVLLLVGSAHDALAQRGTNGRGKQSKPKEEPAIATVNGVKIPYRWYQQELRSFLERRGLAKTDTTSLTEVDRDDVFLRLIDAELIRQVAEKRDIVVDRDAATQMLLANPPSYIRDVFVDDKGNFRDDLFRENIRNPENIRRLIADPNAPADQLVASWKEDIDQVIRYYQIEETRQRLIDSLYAARPLTESDIEHRYFAEKTTVEGSIVGVMHSTYPDSLVPVTEEEARAWYRDHLEEYDIPRSRRITTVILPMVPSSADSAVRKRKMDSIVSLIGTVPYDDRLRVVDDVIKSLPKNRIPVDQAIQASVMPAEVIPDLVAASDGSVVGPYLIEDELVSLYVNRSFPVGDSLVRVRHILFRVPVDSTDEFKQGIEGMAGLLRDSIKTEQDFIRAAQNFSADESSSDRGGDLGYMKKGVYVPAFDSAVFNSPIGRAIGPIKTEFGVHLIWVIDRVAESYEMRELRFPVTVSAGVVAEVSADAQRLAEALRMDQGEDVLMDIRGKYPETLVDTSWIKQLEPYADGLAVSTFAFQSGLGDVEILRLPFDRLAVIKVLEEWRGGAPAYDEFSIYPISHVRRKKQLDLLEPRMHRLADTLTVDMLLGPIREIAPLAEVYELLNQKVTAPPDEEKTLLDSLVAVTVSGGVSGPVRGKHGWYFLRLWSRFGPDREEYLRSREAYRQDYLHRYREELLEEIVVRARAEGEIGDPLMINAGS